MNSVAKNENDFATKIGLDRADSIYKITRYGGNPGTKTIQRINQNFPQFNSDWLLTGEGEMLLSNGTSLKTHTEIALENRRKMKDFPKNDLIPIYDDVITLGSPEGVEQPQMLTPMVGYIDSGGWFKGATAAIRHYGDSMLEYPSGCILALKELHEIDFVWGENYVIEYGEDYTRFTKRIQAGRTQDTIIAYSTNEDKYTDGTPIYQPKEIAINRIKRAFLVLGSVIKNHSITGVVNIH